MKNSTTAMNRRFFLPFLFVIAAIVSVAVYFTFIHQHLQDQKLVGTAATNSRTAEPTTSLPSPSQSPVIIGFSEETHGSGKDERTGSTTTPLFTCPSDTSAPITLSLPEAAPSTGFYSILLAKSSTKQLCALYEAAIDDERLRSGPRPTDLQLRPIGRSYNGGGWEAYLSTLYNNIIPSSCSDGASVYCHVDLPPLAEGRRYIMKSYEHTLPARDEAARFLERVTFGPTTAEIDNFDGPYNWLDVQFHAIPTSSHRQFLREHTTNWQGETSSMGLVQTKPCDAGARYRRYAFVGKDSTRILTIKTSPYDTSMKILAVDGKVRTLVKGPVTAGWDDIVDVRDGR
jgi:hypothetical protein